MTKHAEIESTQFDLVVIGGGIHGVAATLEASRRGLKTALVEQGDFGAATSRNSLQVLHGGLRYLQSLDFWRFRESVIDRAFFLREFPDLTDTIPFLFPLDGAGLRRPGVFRCALTLNDWASAPFQRSLPESQKFNPGTTWSRDTLRSQYPDIADERFVGAGLWSDGHLTSPRRLFVEMLRWAESHDAELLNHTKLIQCHPSDGAWSVEVQDQISGEEFRISSKKVLLTGGPWSRRLAETLSGGTTLAQHLHPSSLAFNVLLRGSLPHSLGVGLTERDGRNLFFWERHGLIHLGTCHHSLPDADLGSSGSRSDPSQQPTDGQVAEFIERAHDAAPGLGFADAELVAVQSGVLTARHSGAAELAHRDAIFCHRDHGGRDGIASVHGVKYTTAPSVAQKALGKLFGELPEYETPRRPASRGPVLATDLVARLASEPRAVRTLLSHIREGEWVRRDDDLLLGRVDGTEDPRLLETLRSFLLSPSEDNL